MARMSYAQAACAAVQKAMIGDKDVVVLGEDVGRGGIFQQYKGLLQEFGAARVIDTPISEATILGAGAQHSQSLEAWFAHVPGLVVATPATPQDNYSLLRAAIDCGDPVIYMEHKELWGLQGEVADERTSLGKARILREGKDVTVVTWSRTVHAALEAASKAKLSAEVIDLRTLWPWDRETVFASAAKTRRVLVVHEAVQAAGFGAEVAATVAEQLGVRVRRLGAPRIPVGYSRPLEDEARITSGRILAALADFDL